ncbi:hypothetical protein [Clostridium botulinum]|nr:hypothetical protein [Clostridium botulinum]
MKIKEELEKELLELIELQEHYYKIGKNTDNIEKMIQEKKEEISKR